MYGKTAAILMVLAMVCADTTTTPERRLSSNYSGHKRSASYRSNRKVGGNKRISSKGGFGGNDFNFDNMFGNDDFFGGSKKSGHKGGKSDDFFGGNDFNFDNMFGGSDDHFGGSKKSKKTSYRGGKSDGHGRKGVKSDDFFGGNDFSFGGMFGKNDDFSADFGGKKSAKKVKKSKAKYNDNYDYEYHGSDADSYSNKKYNDDATDDYDYEYHGDNDSNSSDGKYGKKYSQKNVKKAPKKVIKTVIKKVIKKNNYKGGKGRNNYRWGGYARGGASAWQQGFWNQKIVQKIKQTLIQKLRLRLRLVLKSELAKIESAFKKAFQLSAKYVNGVNFNDVFSHRDFLKLFQRNYGQKLQVHAKGGYARSWRNNNWNTRGGRKYATGYKGKSKGYKKNVNQWKKVNGGSKYQEKAGQAWGTNYGKNVDINIGYKQSQKGGRAAPSYDHRLMIGHANPDDMLE